MEKGRDGDKARGCSGPLQRLDLASAVDALYAPWLQQEQALLSNMFGGGGGANAHHAYSAAAAAAAMGGLGALQGLPPGYPSSSAGLASLAAAQQQQHQQQAAAIASLGSSAAWWNLAGLHQMELLSRLQGGLGSGLGGGYPGLHPEHLINLEILQAQHAAAMAAALSSASSSTQSKASSSSRTSSNGSTSSSGSTSVKASSRGSSGRVRSSRDVAARSYNRASSTGGHHSPISVRSDLGGGGTPGVTAPLSYGIANLMADKMPSSVHRASSSRPPSSSSTSSNPPPEALRNKELEIIPISPSGGGKETSNSALPPPSHLPRGGHSQERGHLSHSEGGSRASLYTSDQLLKAPSSHNYSHRGSGDSPKVSITNGVPWKEESPHVSIEPCGGPDDAPLNLSLKTGAARNDKRGTNKESHSQGDLLSKLKPPGSLNPFEYHQGLGLGLGLMPDMAPSLEVLHSLYGHQGEPRDVLASMQEALQRQLLATETKKREEKKKRARTNSSVQITPVGGCSESSLGSKRHLVAATSHADGRLVTTIKTAMAPGMPPGIQGSTRLFPGLSEMSDSDSDEDSTSMSSGDDDNTPPPSGGGGRGTSSPHFPSPWLKRDSSDLASFHSGSPPTKKRKMITDEASLRVPLRHGWRRETTMRGVTQSGVRGEVIYYAPCGKPFKQYPDIIRYLERQSIADVTRDNFSFSSKITVGEYVDATTQHRYTEHEIRDIVREIRAKKGLRVQQQQLQAQLQQQMQLQQQQEKGGSSSSGSKYNTASILHQQQSQQQQMQHIEVPMTTAAKLAALQAKEGRDVLELEAEAILRRLEAEEKAAKSRHDLISKIEEQRHIRAWKEQEKMKKQEELRREKEEREQEKQKQKVLKEQFYLQELNKQREMFYTLELERERRRYHGILVRSLEARKRYEEREKRREFLREEKRVFKERKREERLAARELTLLLKEVKEDMELTDHQPLPDIDLLNGLRLSPEAFGNVLMIFEFLHTFGETLGFDMESLPSLNSLQLALLQDGESEEELLSVLSHLLVCAIEDPGVPNSQRNPTILGQTLNRADITPTNISEILRVYLYANATGEVRSVYGLHGTEKERREHPARSAEWDVRLGTNEAFRMSMWLSKVPFLALNPSQKGSILGYVCNELLQNKAVTRQIEESLDKHNALKTRKWKLDARIRKLRMCVARKRIYNVAMRSMLMMETPREDSEDLSSSSLMWETDKKDATLSLEKTPIKEEDEDEKLKEEEDEEEEEENESGNESEAMTEETPQADEDEDKHLNADEAAKALDLLQKQMEQVRLELFETAQQVRGYNAGQDRYQRTMWVLPHAGGPFLEGLNTCDYVGRSQFPLDVPPPRSKDGYSLEEVAALRKKSGEIKDEEVAGKEKEMKLEKVPTLSEEEVREDEEVEEELKETDISTIVEIGVVPEKVAAVPDRGGGETPTPPATDSIDKDLVATGLGLIPGQYLRPEHVAQYEKLNFSLLPRCPCDPLTLSMYTDPPSTPPHGNSPTLPPASPFVSSNGGASTPLSSLTPILQNSNLSHKELLEKLHQSAEALPVPPEYLSGLWHVKDEVTLKALLDALNERGARERELKRFLEKNFNIVRNSLTKVDGDVMTLEAPEDECVLYDEFGVPVEDNPAHWSIDVSLKVDLLALEAVYAMEDKITNASMQNKNWRLGEANERPHMDFRASSCVDDDENRPNPIHVGRDLLQALEEGIERRYLKPPLGIVPAPKNEGGPVETTKCPITDYPKGLTTWREAVSKCETAAQLAMCTYMLETAVAWDKSIMKAYCQFCHSGDFEEKLLLCDGCDKGYHTHCFKPPMETIPDGDWYCYECVNKFSETAQRHCLTCGGTEGRNLIHCSSCPRAYHNTCINPPLAKVPRNKWNCPACSSKSPRGRRGRTKNPLSTPTTPTNNPSTSTAASTPATPKSMTTMAPTNNLVTPTTSLITSPTTVAMTTTTPTSSSPTLVTSVTTQQQLPPSSPMKEVSIAAICDTVDEDVPQRCHDDEETPVIAVAPPTTPNGVGGTTTPKKERGIKKKDARELLVCKALQSDLEKHEDSWPFLVPVNTRQFPTYKKIIKKPIDLSTIRRKLEDTVYRTKEDYSDDLRLMFNNCETFNEDDSPVGKAGHALRSFFEAKWADSFTPT